MDVKNALDMPVDTSGNEKTVIKSKTTNDPEGLFNKTTTSQIRQEMPNH
jgi:hypothetical protein